MCQTLGGGRTGRKNHVGTYRNFKQMDKDNNQPKFSEKVITKHIPGERVARLWHIIMQVVHPTPLGGA